MDIYVKVQGLTGPVTTGTRAGSFRCSAFSWRRSPFKLVRGLDGASGPLLNALAAGQPLGTVVVGADAADPKTGTRPVATYELRSASVLRIALTAVSGGADSVTEEVELAYGQIGVAHDPTGTKILDTQPSNP
jgi:type VI protein secretion system component Hcp